ncbi:hypothetical protein CRUP_004569 [Coryphaenoides rupestris]|nr:hypothetical protein CRUP_004569 [Coryphaenoides rupestris]
MATCGRSWTPAGPAEPPAADPRGAPHAGPHQRSWRRRSTQLRASRDLLEEEVHGLRGAGEEQCASLLAARQSLQAQQGELEQAHARQEQTLQNYNRLLHARDQEVARLQNTVALASPAPPPAPHIQGESLESGEEKQDLSKAEVARLLRGVQEKEIQISQLTDRTVSLAQVVRQKDLELQALQARAAAQQLQAYALEREQVLSVLNEKTRENSQLRSDYHRLMDVEAALLKLQQESAQRRLGGSHLASTDSDPSGSQEMFRETIQNLSRIIREKDIEIDALTQKCQTLVAVLQEAAGPEPGRGGGGGGGGSCGVSSNQFEELLQERDTLKQQVKKVEEWKQQVITTVRNMQHESAQLQAELVALQGRVEADSDCSSQLSVDYARLIQSYERKERRLGSLGLELVQVQHCISQLSSTKDALLGRLDSVVVGAGPEEAGGGVVGQVAPSSTGTPGPPDAGLQQLQQEVRSLRTLVAERDALIRTLQENSHHHHQQQQQQQRGQAKEEEKKKEAAEQEALCHAHERLDALQRSARDKDLLIKTKGDQLARASEALRAREADVELLRQAVTNLKERALVLELEGRALRDESEAKESDFGALQETNMQVSFLLREKEFQLGAVGEKAATLERMLKDKEQVGGGGGRSRGEQGKSGELNQLLNEVRSMQEKAVLFQQERDHVMLALKQKQMETTARVTDKEQRLKVELERLRSHLLEMEDSYTRDALAAEDREVELRRRVALLDQRLATSSNAVENASQQASMQVESLQEQLSLVVRQRDDALLKLHTSQEQVQQYAVSLSNLQMKAMYSLELDKLRREKEEHKNRAERLEDKASALQMNLDEANSALESASRLTDQLDLNEEQMEDLRKQVVVRQEMLEEAQKKLMSLLNSTEGKVDKLLMRNLFLGYFHTPRSKRSEVLRLMGSVLGLSHEDVDKMLEEDGRPGVTGWVSSWLGGRGAQSVPNTPQRPGHAQTLNSMLVHDIKALSAPPPGRGGAGASSGAGKRSSDSNPFLAPRSAAVPLLGGGGIGGGGAGLGSGGVGGHLLMKPISDALPTFTPVPVSTEASGLKDLLKQ